MKPLINKCMFVCLCVCGCGCWQAVICFLSLSVAVKWIGDLLVAWSTIWWSAQTHTHIPTHTYTHTDTLHQSLLEPQEGKQPDSISQLPVFPWITMQTGAQSTFLLHFSSIFQSASGCEDTVTAQTCRGLNTVIKIRLSAQWKLLRTVGVDIITVFCGAHAETWFLIWKIPT